MATIALGLAGAAIGTSIGGGLLGISSVVIGKFIGSTIGNVIDNALLAGGQKAGGLDQISLTRSAEGQIINRVWGSVRTGGNIIWAAKFKEFTQTGGGKATSSGDAAYSLSFAVGLCEGNSNVRMGRAWIDGEEADKEKLDYVFYPGSETQTADPTMETVEGSGNVPAYRGLAYVVFTDLDLTPYGNRVPQISIEVIKPVASLSTDSAELMIEGVNLIPATGEAVYGTTVTVQDDGYGNATVENAVLSADKTNLQSSMDNLSETFTNIGGVNLVCSWFGDDLRASTCEIRPKVEAKTGRVLTPNDWSVQGMTRSHADIEAISTKSGGGVAFGSTPADWSIVEAIVEMGDVNGMDVAFYPFLLMDIPAGNTLPDTDTGAAGQPAYPWRGRITTSLPAVDKTAAAQTEVDSLFGSVVRGDFSVSGTTVTYTGAAGDWGYRRFILHYAHLCAAAAGTMTTPAKFKRFYIGSEMVGVTRIRSTASSTATASTVYPGVNAMVSLLEEVRALFDAAGLTSVELSYAADWSEYMSHRPDDGSGDVYYNMDAIWGHADCDHVSFDNYLPISDWRDGTTHEDYGTGSDSYGNAKAENIYDLTYLKGQIEGGELFDWYYASSADRDAQTRTAVSSWTYAQKNIRSWWTNTHKSRPGGTEDGAVVALDNGSGGSAATWSAAAKRIAFSEFGCPAIDKGPNQPNVFYDPDSSESAVPYYSSSLRDDMIQRRYLEAMLTYWRDNAPTVGSVTMVDPTDMAVWTWDARPYPAFPARTDLWSDGGNWNLGHWATGRYGGALLADVVTEICTDAGISSGDIDVTSLAVANSEVKGLIIDSQASHREILSVLATAYLFDIYESGGKVTFVARVNATTSTLADSELSAGGRDMAGWASTRKQEADLPSEVAITFLDIDNDYQTGTSSGVERGGAASAAANIVLPVVMDEQYGKSLAETLLRSALVSAEGVEVSVSPTKLALDPTDIVTVTLGGQSYSVRVEEASIVGEIQLRGRTDSPQLYEGLASGTSENTGVGVDIFGRSQMVVMDLPLFTGQEDSPWAPRVAAYQKPWPNSVDIYTTSRTPITQIPDKYTIGETTASFASGTLWRRDHTATLSVMLYDPNGQLLSITDSEFLDGGNLGAVELSGGEWELVQFKTATLTGSSGGLPIYDLTVLLRGQFGTNSVMEASVAAGAKVVFINPLSVDYLDITSNKKTTAVTYTYGPSNDEKEADTYQTITHTGLANGLVPYDPVQLHKADAGSGDLAFSWVRRTRFDGDDWEPETIPLNEESEKYDLEIYDPSGPTLLRALTDLTSASYTYSAADQATDGGTLASYLIRVWQKSATIGRGRQAEATL